MPRNRKYFVHDTVLFVSSRTEEGLPLVSSMIMNLIIWGILARARNMYSVRVCHFMFMFNHFHMLLVVENPEHVSEFIGYVKGEIAHAVNRLLGRKRKTIWLDGYDSPVVLTASDVMKYIQYLYINPVKANLVEKVKDYPGVSSWDMLVSEVDTRKCRHLRRTSIPKLPLPAITVKEQRRLEAQLESSSAKVLDFVLEPFAWMRCFPEFSNKTESAVKSEILESIRRAESENSQERRKAGKTVVGATSLRRQSMLKEYAPKKHSQRMLCLCSEKELRKAYVSHFRALCMQARVVYEKWKYGETRFQLPPGLFAPRLPTLVAALSLSF